MENGIYIGAAIMWLCFIIGYFSVLIVTKLEYRNALQEEHNDLLKKSFKKKSKRPKVTSQLIPKKIKGPKSVITI